MFLLVSSTAIFYQIQIQCTSKLTLSECTHKIKHINVIQQGSKNTKRTSKVTKDLAVSSLIKFQHPHYTFSFHVAINLHATAGTLNADQPRDLDLIPLQNRFYLQPLSPAEAAARAKESAKDIVNLKELIDKKIEMALRPK